MTSSIFDRRVVLIADSLSLPREDVRYTDTYPHRIRRRRPGTEVVSLGRGEATTEHLAIDAGDALSPVLYEPDVVVTQLGIVDCAPRFSHPLERRLIFDVVPDRLADGYAALVKRLRTPRPRWRRVDPEAFERNLSRFYGWAGDQGVSVASVPIRPPTPALERKSPRAPEAIERFNAIYERLADAHRCVTLLDPYAGLDRDDLGVGDGIHLSTEAHAAVATAVDDYLDGTD